MFGAGSRGCVQMHKCVASNMCPSAIAQHRTCAQVQLRSIEHVRKCNCVASNMCASAIA